VKVYADIYKEYVNMEIKELAEVADDGFISEYRELKDWMGNDVIRLPTSELRALELLFKVASESPNVSLMDGGLILAIKGHASVVLDVPLTLWKKVEDGDNHLVITVALLKQIQELYGVPEQSHHVCVECPGVADGIPIGDSCVSFVRMVDAGWPVECMPHTLQLQIHSVNQMELSLRVESNLGLVATQRAIRADVPWAEVLENIGAATRCSKAEVFARQCADGLVELTRDNCFSRASAEEFWDRAYYDAIEGVPITLDLLERGLKTAVICIREGHNIDSVNISINPFIAKYDPLTINSTIRMLNSMGGRQEYVDILTYYKDNPLEDERAVELLVVALKDGHNWVRRVAAESLGNIGDERAVEPLIYALEDENIGVRRFAAVALGKIGDERAVKPLIFALEDYHDYVSRDAAVALGNIGGELAVELLIQSLKNDNEVANLYAADALGLIGDERAVTPLVGMLKGHDDAGDHAAEALAKIGGTRAVDLLIVALKDKDGRVRSDAAGTLGKIGDERAVEPLFEGMQNEDDDYDGGHVRLSCAWALVNIGSERAIALLNQARNNEDYNVGFFAAMVLEGYD